MIGEIQVETLINRLLARLHCLPAAGASSGTRYLGQLADADLAVTFVHLDSHGVEPRATRVAAGKSETGEITLTVRQAGNEVMITLDDDGGGIDLSRVRERAKEVGLVAPDAEPTEAQLVEFLFRPGFSTASNHGLPKPELEM